MAQRSRWLWAVFAGLGVWALIFFVSLGVGPAGLARGDIILELRLPRAIMAAAVGMGLSVAGAVLQALFANPLCEPYTLGVSSGSALGAVLGAWLGLPLVFAGVTGSAFVGAMVFVGILYFISLRGAGGKFALLLSGVMLGFLGSSLVSIAMAFSDPNGIQGALFWLLGDLSRARFEGSIASLVAAIVLVLALWSRWRGLDALLVGEENARALGVDVNRARRVLLLLSSLLIGVCVSGAGMIGFVGLVVPHFARRQVGSLHFRLIPVCAIWGAALLTAADSLTRSVVQPYELPVGVVTALIGAPAFLWILLNRREAA